MELNEFKNWLDNNTEYTKKTKGNIVSRVRRANCIVPIKTGAIYFFELSQSEEFNRLSASVKSQIKKAANLYIQYIEDSGEETDEI